VNAAIRTRDLVKRFDDVVAVDGLSLEVQRGECFGLLGPNGAGKTTTLEILEGLTEPTSGEVEVLGRRWSEDPEALRAQLGVALQETRLADRLTVQETLQLFRSFYADGADVDAVITAVQLGEKRKAWVSKLSGGQRQRLAIATALVGNPALLFLDEPTTGLDPQSRRALWDLVAGLKAEGRTILLTTHYMEEAERLCDRVAVVDHGKVIALGSPRELIATLGGSNVVEFTCAPALPVPELAALPSVESVRPEGEGFQLTVHEPHVALPALLAAVAASGGRLTALTTRHATLEDVFVALTGRHLRED
jgi:ABC-2 type transport system ATP-binding protein